jgi:threonine dehydrogenase-like Zn-dependent dehydrogenase
MGKGSVEVADVPDPAILNERDAIIRVTSTAICGSDLHLYNGLVKPMKKGDVLGHEFMGEVMELGRGVKNLKVGDRVVVPFTIACGDCWHCQHDMWSLCENSNPSSELAEKEMGHAASGAFGYSHMTGGFAGGQAEYVRVPFADVGPLKIDDSLDDEQVLFLSDILPTGYMAAEMCDIQPGDTVAVWGCGPVGLFAIKSAFFLGAERVIAIDHLDYRLQMAREKCEADVLNFDSVKDVPEAVIELTAGRGPDACIDAVGMEALGHGFEFALDRAKQALSLESDRPIALREAIKACRNGGTVSVVGVYGGVVDQFPVGTIMNRGLTIKSGQCHVHRYMPTLLEHIGRGEIDPSMVITHRLPLGDAAKGYEMFDKKEDNCEKVVLKPGT